MKRESKILDTIRKASKGVHAEIEREGVSQKFKRGTFTKSDYIKWLADAYKINDGLFSLCHSRFSTHNIVKEFMPSDSMLDNIVIDLLVLDDVDVAKQHEIQFSIGDEDDLCIAAVYTFLSSQMGTAIIGKYLTEHEPNWSRCYIDAMSKNFDVWKMFLNKVSRYYSSVPVDKFYNYTEVLWNQIYADIVKNN